VVDDSADVTSSGRSFHVCGLVTTCGSAMYGCDTVFKCHHVELYDPLASDHGDESIREMKLP